MSKTHLRNNLYARTAFIALGFSSVLTIEAAAQADRFSLEEIVVTARKREERLQDIPDAISTFSASAIEDAGIASVKDFTNLIPNMSLIQAQNQGTVAINIRGIGQVRNGEPPVAMVIDGVQLSSPNQITQELYDIERIEVLKGPQGALYGRNAIGGAVNIITKQPSNDFEHFLRLSAANGFDLKVQGGSSGPIVEDKVLYRISGSYQDFNGVIPNVTLGEDVDFMKDKNLRGRLLILPTERLSFDIRASYSKYDGGASWYIPLPDGQPNNTTEQVQGNILGLGNRELQEYALKIEYEADFATLTSVTAYSSTEEYFYEELDWLATPILAAQQDLDVEAWSQEFRLTSPSNQAVRWMLGTYFIDTKRYVNTVVYVDLDTSLLEVANPVDKSRNKAAAGFGQVSFNLTDALEATLALRYDRDKRKQTSLTMGIVSEDTFSAWQPKVSLAYKWTEDAMTYVTAGRGFRSGGFNQGTVTFPPQYAAETNWNYEFGFKTSWLDNLLQVNGAAFWMEFKNQHVFLFDTGIQGIVNINKTRIKGVELEVRARPARGLDIFGSIGLLDAKIRDFNGTGLYDGSQSPLTNEWSANFGIQYAHDLGGDYTLIGRVDYATKGDLFWHVDNIDKQSAHHIVDARLTLEVGEIWKLTAFAKNLFNEKYTEEFFSTDFTGLVADIRWPNTPRRYGIEATYRF